jgi:hypothetical protein
MLERFRCSQISPGLFGMTPRMAPRGKLWRARSRVKADPTVGLNENIPTMPTLPGKARALTISTFDSHLDPSARTCDLTELLFIDAYGLVGTASALRAGLDEASDLQVVPPASTNSGSHLANMGFRAFLDERGLSTDLPVRSAADVSGVVVPLRTSSLGRGLPRRQVLSRLPQPRRNASIAAAGLLHRRPRSRGRSPAAHARCRLLPKLLPETQARGALRLVGASKDLTPSV